MENKKITNIDDYIAGFPAETQKILQRVRQLIKENAPDASEKISWDMPTFFLYGNLVHFAGHKNHLGFYPGDSGITNFADRMEGMSHSKGAVQFPYSKPMPEELIKDIVRFRVKQNIAWNEEKLAKKKKEAPKAK